MEAFALYLLKSAIWITAFTLVYLLFLKSERYFVLKRIYLVSGVLFSILFPLITIHYEIEMPMNYTGDVSGAGSLNTSAILTERTFSFSYLVAGIYLLGIIVLIAKSFYQFYRLLYTINRSEVEPLGPARLIRDSKYISSFSFFNYVFVNPSISRDEMKEIINHELVHITQKHWFDLLLCELTLLLQWANPFIWIYTGFVRLNHEYIADELALQRSSDPAVYKAALLNQVFSAPVISLSNSFNYSITKTRFDMMKKIILSPYRKFKLLVILPVIAGGFYAFAEPEYKVVPASAVLDINAGNPIIENVNPMPAPEELNSPVSETPVLYEKPQDNYMPEAQKVVKIDTVKEVITDSEDTLDEEPFYIVEEDATYPGGIEAINKHIEENLVYPREAVSQKIEGKVTVRFAVAKDGSVKNVTVIKEVHPLLDEEAIRVVKTLKNFNPGKQGGVPVPVWMMLPITFKL